MKPEREKQEERDERERKREKCEQFTVTRTQGGRRGHEADHAVRAKTWKAFDAVLRNSASVVRVPVNHGGR